MSANPEDFDTSDSKLTLAKHLVGFVWGSNSMPATFDVEYEGVKWEVFVRVKEADA